MPKTGDFPRKNRIVSWAAVIFSAVFLLFSIPRAGAPVQSVMTAAAYNDVVLNNGLYFTANRWGLEVFKIEDNNKLISVARTFTRGRAEFVDIQNNLIAVGNLDGIIELFEINGEDLRPVGSIDPGFHPLSIKIMDDLLYVGGLETALTVFDISDPRFPSETGYIDFEGYPHQFIARNDTMFIAAYHGGVVLLDISEPSNPSMLAQYEMPNFVYGIELDDSLIYACAHSAGLYVLDLNERYVPPIIGHNDAFNSARKAVLTDEGLLVLDGFGALSMVDVSDPTDPQTVWGNSLDFNCYNFILEGDIVTIANWNNGMKLYEIDLKEGVQLIDEYIVNSVCRSVSIDNGHVYAGAGTGGLLAFDPDLNEIGGYAAGENCLEVKTYNGYAFLSNSESGFSIVDITNPANIKPISSWGESRGWARSSTYNGEALYLANWQGIVSFDLVDIQNPLEIGYLDTDFGSSKIENRNDTLFVAGSGGLELYDISNPSSIIQLENYVTDYPAVGLELKGDIIFLASGLGGVDILSISGELEPISRLDALEFANGTQYINGLLYVAENYSGVSEWDLSSMESPVYIRNLKSSGKAVGLDYFEGKLYVADYYGVTVFEPGPEERAYSNRNDLTSNSSEQIISYPNPVNGSAKINFELKSPGRVEISLYDLLGRKVKSVFSGYLYAGRQSVTWNSNHVASGCYFVKVSGADYSSAGRITVIK